MNEIFIVANIVLWSPSGETYAVATRSQVIVYKVSVSTRFISLAYDCPIIANCADLRAN